MGSGWLKQIVANGSEIILQRVEPLLSNDFVNNACC
jgi:hypothetical protein